MVESTDFRECHHAPFRRRLNASWDGRVLLEGDLEGEMCSRPVIIGEIAGQDTPQVPLAEHDHVVQTLAPD
jgi:hypothetical protein